MITQSGSGMAFCFEAINHFWKQCWRRHPHVWFIAQLFVSRLWSQRTILNEPISSCCFTSQIYMWRHQLETLSALLALCAGNSPVTGEIAAQRSVTRSFDVFFDLRLNKQLSKQSRGRWFDTPSRSLWRHCNVSCFCHLAHICISYQYYDCIGNIEIISTRIKTLFMGCFVQIPSLCE